MVLGEIPLLEPFGIFGSTIETNTKTFTKLQSRECHIVFYSKTNQVHCESLNTLLAVTCVVFYQSWFFHQDKWANSCSKQCRRHQTQSSNTPNIIQPSLFSISQRERETSKPIETLINGLNYGLYGDYAKLLNTLTVTAHKTRGLILTNKIMLYWAAYRDYVENTYTVDTINLLHDFIKSSSVQFQSNVIISEYEICG